MQRIGIESLTYCEGEESSELSNYYIVQMELCNIEAAAIRNVETFNIDCLTPENIWHHPSLDGWQRKNVSEWDVFFENPQ